MTEKITILVGNYNKEKYINQTFESIFSQSNIDIFKVIVCEDASTDNSLEIIKKWVEKYPNKIALFINEKNGGMFYTLVKMYRNIKTPYFTVLDSDDYWINNNFLEDGVNFLDTNLDFSIYATNTLIENINTNDKKLAFDSNGIITHDINNFTWTHTSSTIFRNNYFTKNILDILETKVKTDVEKCYEGDTFRNIVHSTKGKIYHDCNKITGVYRYNVALSGWSSLSIDEQHLLNSKLYCEMYNYFNKKI
jgi:glycosyltransferase involved in cell wall biosynthesis